MHQYARSQNTGRKPNGIDFSFFGQLTSICLLLRCPLEWILRFDHPITSIGLALNASSGNNLILEVNSDIFPTEFLKNSVEFQIEFCFHLQTSDQRNFKNTEQMLWICSDYFFGFLIKTKLILIGKMFCENWDFVKPCGEKVGSDEHQNRYIF